MTTDQNQSAHIRAAIAASPEPLSFGEVAESAGVAKMGLGASLNAMVKRGHLIRTGALGSFRYAIGSDEIRTRCETEEERRTRYVQAQLRRNLERRQAHGWRPMAERRAAGDARRAAKQAARDAAKAARESKAAAHRAEVVARAEARTLARQQKADAQAAQIAVRRAAAATKREQAKTQRQAACAARRAEVGARKQARQQAKAERAAARVVAPKRPAKVRPKVVKKPRPAPKPKATQYLSIGPSAYTASKAPPRQESVEEYLQRGGSVEVLPGFQRIAERPVTNYGRHYQ